MPIEFDCNCGKHLKAPDGSAGRKARCPQCGEILVVPQPTEAFASEADDLFALKEEPTDWPTKKLPTFITPREPLLPRATSARTVVRETSPIDITPTGIKRHLYWLMLLVLIPLAWTTLHHRTKDDFRARLIETVTSHPEVAAKLDRLGDDATKKDLMAALPGDKLDGALLADQTWVHWLFAFASGGAFLVAALLLFSTHHAKWQHLAGIGVLTGTLGILLLLAFQWLAFHMPFFTPRGIIGILLDIVWLIGQSYAMALGDHGLFVSFLGFTAGVGFCEEACKALPLIFRARSHGYSSWRSAMLWGLISGIGFGVSEGISYSSDYYNGVAGANEYLVRFISCVGLHGIWAAAVGITIFRRQDFFRGQMHPLEWIWRVLQAVIVPMVLHGLYDTLLKQDHDGWALLVAVASFGWLAVQIELAQRHFDEQGVPHRALA